MSNIEKYNNNSNNNNNNNNNNKRINYLTAQIGQPKTIAQRFTIPFKKVNLKKY
jgi:hypothetical protein